MICPTQESGLSPPAPNKRLPRSGGGRRGAGDERGAGGGRGDGRGRREHDSDGSDDEDRIPFGVSDGAKHNRNYQRLLRNFGIDAEENSAIKLAHLERYPINRFQHFRNPTNNPQVNRDIEEQLS